MQVNPYIKCIWKVLKNYIFVINFYPRTALPTMLFLETCAKEVRFGIASLRDQYYIIVAKNWSLSHYDCTSCKIYRHLKLQDSPKFTRIGIFRFEHLETLVLAPDKNAKRRRGKRHYGNVVSIASFLMCRIAPTYILLLQFFLPWPALWRRGLCR
jgi:hypothetical protein